jgi:hypothetical protein
MPLVLCGLELLMASVASQKGGGGTVLVSGDFFGREHCDGGDVSSVIYRFNVMSIRGDRRGGEVAATLPPLNPELRACGREIVNMSGQPPQQVQQI